jgi:hypothetical protein
MTYEIPLDGWDRRVSLETLARRVSRACVHYLQVSSRVQSEHQTLLIEFLPGQCYSHSMGSSGASSLGRSVIWGLAANAVYTLRTGARAVWREMKRFSGSPIAVSTICGDSAHQGCACLSALHVMPLCILIYFYGFPYNKTLVIQRTSSVMY